MGTQDGPSGDVVEGTGLETSNPQPLSLALIPGMCAGPQQPCGPAPLAAFAWGWSLNPS